MAGQSSCLRFAIASRLCTAIAMLALVASGSQCGAQQPPAVRRELRRMKATTGPFTPDWDSLGAYRVPAWFRDAKFGIFIHWGVYSVPAFGNEWYSRNMYQQGTPAFQHQQATYGPQSQFGYKDFIPMFRGEHFDPARWVDLFARAGARYVVPVAEHCDGFAMYDSDITPWNAARMGPHRDVVGELAAAARARGLRFGVSSHRAEHWWWYGGGMRFDSDVRDPRYASLYGPAQPMALPGSQDTKEPDEEPDPYHLEQWLPPSAVFLDDWLARSVELVDKYHPDFLYFDWWIGQPAFRLYLKKFAAYYYDEAAQRGQPVVLTYKQEAMPANTAVLDVERGKLDAVRLLPWETDTSVSIHSWGYVDNDEYRDAGSLIDELVDVVSKNGNLLLNVGPRADGTIPEQAQSVLLRIGAWLRVNGEAIYGSRPWFVYGEGPTRGASLKKNTDRQELTPQDIRFTTRNGAVYAIALGRPQNGELLVRAMYRGTPYLDGPVCAAHLLGSSSTVEWSQKDDGLHIALPPDAPEEPAYIFRILELRNHRCAAEK
jgi:alpha-L-fucosidase